MLQTPGGFELTLLVIVVGFAFFAVVAVGITALSGYVGYQALFVDDPDVEGASAPTDDSPAEAEGIDDATDPPDAGRDG
jgi:hypothetical protein